jgi:catechol 2,3-dioxygenase
MFPIHILLTVSALPRSQAFNRGVLGYVITRQTRDHAPFLSAGGHHHHLGLNTWAGVGAPPPPPGTTGLCPEAIVYPSRADLGRALRRVLEAGPPVEGAADHGMSEAVYLWDPDGNGVEPYVDRLPTDSPRDPLGEPAMVTRPLDLQARLRHGAGDGVAEAWPPGRYCGFISASV